MMNRRNYESCAFFAKGDGSCTYPGRDRLSGLGSCKSCTFCPLRCMQMPGRPDECPHGRPRGVNTLGGAE